MTSRVHPGETPSSFVFNGFLDFILKPDDPRAQMLRHNFIFKLIPLINPDGVFHGHYRTDTRGVNLNRVYLDPSPELHPSVYAAWGLVLYHHCVYGQMNKYTKNIISSNSDPMMHLLHLTDKCSPMEFYCRNENVTNASKSDVLHPSDECFTESNVVGNILVGSPPLQDQDDQTNTTCDTSTVNFRLPHLQEKSSHLDERASGSAPDALAITRQSGVAAYIDLHAHASKRGCFMYGNYFKDQAEHVECMLLPCLVSLNSANFDFNHCLFSERNMYAGDRKNGCSKEGSGRVALYKATGIIHRFLFLFPSHFSHLWLSLSLSLSLSPSTYFSLSLSLLHDQLS